jgi:hypothetical protein
MHRCVTEPYRTDRDCDCLNAWSLSGERQEINCASRKEAPQCTALSGTCVTERDGYFYVGSICASLGILLLLLFIRPAILYLQKLDATSWRITNSGSQAATCKSEHKKHK